MHLKTKIQKESRAESAASRISPDIIRPSSLKISDANDIQETEADMVADRVMMMPDYGYTNSTVLVNTEPKMQLERSETGDNPIQMQVEEDEEVNEIQMKPEIQKQGVDADDSNESEEDEGSTIQMKGNSKNNGKYVPIEIEAGINRSKGNGEPLNPLVQREMESKIGADFNNVRIYKNDDASKMNKQLNAKAFTHGNDIYFNKGQYNPESNGGKHLLAHELAHTIQQNKGVERKIQAFRVTRAARVPSLVIRRFETTLVPGKWGTLRVKMQQRDTLITSALSRTTAGTAVHTALTSLLARWPSIRRRLNNTRFNSVTGTLPGRAAITTAITDDRADRRIITGRGNRFIRGAIIEFITALNNYLSDRDTLDQERIQYQRFDNLFIARDIRTLLGAIPHATFTSADVKALVSQETGDITNTAVHGITTGRPGYSQHIMNRRGYIGLGQHNTIARSAAIAWAASQGVTIAARPDPRHIPAESIKLVAAYLGRVMQMLYSNLPDNKPTGDELKKMVFASYNDGHTRVYQGANNFVGTRTINYTWDDIKNTSPIRSHPRAYVDGILSRIG
ncbi:MAG: DUF4157 domain-containing protein [Bacteroidales bacterium]|nr:DUF4157 domain-containing protein [Bacteroidales bacterium]